MNQITVLGIENRGIGCKLGRRGSSLSTWGWARAPVDVRAESPKRQDQRQNLKPTHRIMHQYHSCYASDGHSHGVKHSSHDRGRQKQDSSGPKNAQLKRDRAPDKNLNVPRLPAFETLGLTSHPLEISAHNHPESGKRKRHQGNHHLLLQSHVEEPPPQQLHEHKLRQGENEPVERGPHNVPKETGKVLAVADVIIPVRARIQRYDSHGASYYHNGVDDRSVHGVFDDEVAEQSGEGEGRGRQKRGGRRGEVGVGVSVHKVIRGAQEAEEGVRKKELCVERCWFDLSEDV